MLKGHPLSRTDGLFFPEGTTLSTQEPKKYIGYHATTGRKIVNFSLKMSPGGIYFAPDPRDAMPFNRNRGGGCICMIVAEITLNNPYVTTDRRTVQHSDADRREFWVGNGYDGLVWIGDNGNPLEILVFAPRQISILKQGRSPRKNSDPDGLLIDEKWQQIYGILPTACAPTEPEDDQATGVELATPSF